MSRTAVRFQFRNRVPPDRTRLWKTPPREPAHRHHGRVAPALACSNAARHRWDVAAELGIVDRGEQNRSTLTTGGDKVIDVLSGEVGAVNLPGTAPQVACEHERSLARADQHLNALNFSVRHPSFLFRLSLRKSPRRRSEPNGVKNPRPANRASAVAAVHRSRREWLPRLNTRCGRRPASWQAIPLLSSLRPGTDCQVVYAARAASDPSRVAAKMSRRFPSPPWP